VAALERPAAPPDVLAVLVENHARFLAFLERRVGSRETAEDILQDGFVRAIERGTGVRDEQSIVAWFYRVLRNAVVDHYRRRGTEDRALVRIAATAESAEAAPDAELFDAVCRCVSDLLDTLKPEYAVAIRRVELENVDLAAFAREAGITPNNAAVRLHRARRALKRQVLRSCGTCVMHQCLDCACGRPRLKPGLGAAQS
jgi:RNA polymerase sigma-70 factor (ECF subfamily)